MTPSFHATLVNGRWGDPALFVERAHARPALLFDLGDLHPLSTRDLLRVSHVFVSHCHLDHLIGFDQLLRVHIGRAKLIRMIGPAGLIEHIGHKLGGYLWDLAHRYADELCWEVAEITAPDRLRRTRFALRSGFAPEPLPDAPITAGVVAATPDFAVTATVLQHHGDCIGYALAEPAHVNIWANRVAERGLAVGPWLHAFKAAVRDGAGDDHPIALPDGGVAPLGTLRDLVSVERGQRIGYVTDVRDTPANRAAIADLCRDADTLFIEASFRAADRARADDRAHLTTTAAGEIARAAGARRVEPFHFSPRYDGDEAAMLEEVRHAFRSGA